MAIDNVTRIPSKELSLSLADNGQLAIFTPWIDLAVKVDASERSWVEQACRLYQDEPQQEYVQRFLHNLKDYPIYYTQPRDIKQFDSDTLESTCFDLSYIDFSSPKAFIDTVGIPFDERIIDYMPVNWQWNLDEILEKSKIIGTEYYDPTSINTSLALTRLESVSKNSQERQGVIPIFKKLLKSDEQSFFRYVGWSARQSHYLTLNSEKMLANAIDYFPKLKSVLHEYIEDEKGHHLFFEDILSKLDYGVDDFSPAASMRYFVDAFFLTGRKSALAFLNLIDFSEAYTFDEADPLSVLIEHSSKPNAGQGYKQHYQINCEHDHSDLGYSFCLLLSPQRREDCILAVRIYELCSHLLASMDANIETLAVVQKQLEKVF